MAIRMTRPLLVLAVMVVVGCSQPPPPEPRRVVVIGIDGAEWAVIDPLRAAGRLPVLDGLITRGARGRLGTFKPTLSPALWTTVATGVTPDVHGVENFVLQRPAVDLPIGSLPPTTLDLVMDLRVGEGCDAGGLELFVDDVRLARVRTEGTTVRAEVPPEPRRERRKGETLTVRLRHACAAPGDAKTAPRPWARLGAVRLVDHDGRIAAEPAIADLGRASGVRPVDHGLELVSVRTVQVESRDRHVPALWNIASSRGPERRRRRLVVHVAGRGHPWHARLGLPLLREHAPATRGRRCARGDARRGRREPRDRRRPPGRSAGAAVAAHGGGAGALRPPRLAALRGASRGAGPRARARRSAAHDP
jgi:hypothetical protein